MLSILFGKFRNKVREHPLDRAIAKLPRANQPWVTAGEAAKAIGIDRSDLSRYVENHRHHWEQGVQWELGETIGPNRRKVLLNLTAIYLEFVYTSEHPFYVTYCNRLRSKR